MTTTAEIKDALAWARCKVSKVWGDNAGWTCTVHWDNGNYTNIGPYNGWEGYHLARSERRLWVLRRAIDYLDGGLEEACALDTRLGDVPAIRRAMIEGPKERAAYKAYLREEMAKETWE